MKYKAVCPKCKTAFGFAEEELNTKVKLSKNELDIEVYVSCEKCGLKLTLLDMQTRASSLQEYAEQNWRDKSQPGND